MKACQPVTMRRLGKLVGVSASSISAVMTNNSRVRVSDATRRRIIDAVRTSGYVHRKKARKAARNFSVAVFSRYALDSGVVSDILKGVETGLMRLAGRMLVHLTDEAGKQIASGDLSCLEELDGVIFLSRVDPVCAQTLAARGLPAVVIGSSQYYGAFDMVYVDPVGYAQTALAYLQELGHTRIGAVLGPVPHYSYEISGMVFADYYRRLFPGDKDQYLRTPKDDAEAYRAFEDLLTMKDHPTALTGACANSIIVAEKRGLKVPQDLSILAYDVPGPLKHKPLSHVGADNTALGQSGVELLLYRKHNPRAPVRHLVLPARISDHGSCRQIRSS